MTYDIQQAINLRGVEPTLGELIRISFTNGSDRICLVRRPGDGRAPALFIVLDGAHAIQEVGGYLKSHYAGLPQPANSVNKFLEMTPSTPLRFALQWMNEHGILYTWQRLRIKQHPGVFTILTGPSVTPDLAAALTVRGLLCRLH